ncbi:MAG: sugar phosphate isomerase/epimerase family protein [Promethearchaeota archaeon]
MIQLALNQNSCKDLKLLDFINYSKRFMGVELDYKKIKKSISSGKVNLNEIQETLEIYSLKLVSIFQLEDFSLSSDKHYKSVILNRLNHMLKYSYKLESDLIIIQPSFLPIPSEPSSDSIEIPKQRIINRTSKRLKDLSKIAYEQDINIGFEFLGLPNSSIATIDEAKEVLKPLESQENVGYIIDTFTLAKTGADINELREIKDFIFLIQLGDLIYDPNSKPEDLISIEDSNRVFPGRGNYDFMSFFELMQKIRYDKPYSIELSKNQCSENLHTNFFKIFKNE